MKNLSRWAIGFASAALFASAAHAGLIADFSAAPWSGADGKVSDSYGGVTVSVLAPADGRLSYSAGDGLGIDSSAGWFLDPDQGDEIDWTEVMGIDLGVSTYVGSIKLTNLYKDEVGGLVTEQGRYRIDGGGWIGFTSNATDGNYTLNIGGSATKIQFAAMTFLGGAFSHEYTVHSIYGNGTSPAVTVPEPTTLTLLGAGLLALALIRRRTT